MENGIQSGLGVQSDMIVRRTIEEVDESMS